MPSPSADAHRRPAPGHGPGADLGPDEGDPAAEPAAELRALLVQLQAIVPKAHPDLLRSYADAIEAVRDGWWAASCAGCGLHINRSGG
jgi:hypothetical protein